MGARGPLKIPQHLRVVDGDEKAGTVAEDVAPVAPDRPFGFPSDELELSELWEEISSKLNDAGLMAACDGPTLELALRHFLAARRAHDAWLRGDVVVGDEAHKGTPRKHPAESVFRAESLAFLEYAKQLGLSFAARARLPSKESDDGDENPFRQTGS